MNSPPVSHVDIAKLRGDAKHCRKLARAFDDKPLVDALNQTADGFDAEADRLEDIGRQAGEGPKPSPGGSGEAEA